MLIDYVVGRNLNALLHMLSMGSSILLNEVPVASASAEKNGAFGPFV